MMLRITWFWDTHRRVAVLAAVTLMLSVTIVGAAVARAIPERAVEPSVMFDSVGIGPAIIGSTWDTCSGPIVYRTDAMGTERDMIEEGLRRISDITSISFAEGTQLTSLPASSDDGLAIGFTDSSHPIFSGFPDAVGRARTTLRSNHIVGAVVAVRTDAGTDDDFGPGDTLGKVLLHELAHALGLGHSTDPASLMYPTLNKLQGDGYIESDIAALVSVTNQDC